MPSRRPTNAEIADRAELHERGLKRCESCHEVKPEAEYHKQPRGAYGLAPRCKPCRKEQQAASWQSRKAGTAGRTAQPHWRNLRVRADCARRRNYGIEPNEWDALVLASEGRCAICNDPMLDDVKVDHDHATGRVRGLLHNACNVGLGMFGDDRERLLRAVAYLDSTHA